MDSIGIDQFRDRFQHWIDRVIDRHQPLKVTGQSGSDFIVVSAKDWEQTQETLYVLQRTGKRYGKTRTPQVSTFWILVAQTILKGSSDLQI